MTQYECVMEAIRSYKRATPWPFRSDAGLANWIAAELLAFVGRPEGE